MPRTILVVDDDAGQRQLITLGLESLECQILEASSGEAALRLLADEQIDMLISDVNMPGMSGLDVLSIVQDKYPGLPVLMVTAYADIRDAVRAVQDGAMDYLEKPIDLDELVEMSCALLGVSKNSEGKNVETFPELPNGVIAESAVMRDLLQDAVRVAPFDARVLLSGESGAGKEVVTELIHAWSPRKDEPLIKINCAAIPENLLESELFGHEKGAFTGAVKQRIGRFEEAGNGTIFLDEISEMALPLQAKLLRVIQEGIFNRVGSNGDLHTGARVIAATNRDLEEEVAKGNFREDLFYRLNVIELFIPPLRERKEDIMLLATMFAEKFSGRSPRFAAAVSTCFTLYEWPGNVRELRNAMERASLMAGGGIILMEHLPRRLQKTGVSEEVMQGDENRMEKMETMVILQTLKEQNYNRTETARVLGINRRTLSYKLRRLAEEGYQINSTTEDS